MKKIFSMMAACALAMGFTACESIPSPYEIFDEIIGGEETDIYYESAACYTGWNLELGSAQTVQYNPWSQGSSYTQATGYQKWDGSDAKSNKEAEGFLVSPKFKTTAKDNNVVFSFDYCIGYANNDKDFAKHTKIYVSKTYNDGTVDLNDWEEINWTATHTSTDWTLANTGNIALPAEYMNQDNVHLAFWFYAPAAGSATFEIKNFVIETGVAGEQPDQPGEGVSGEPAGDGSQANPFNVAATIDFVNKLQKNAKSDPVYIKGIVKKFKAGEEPGNQYGNATFYIVDSDDAAEDFYCYRVMGPGNKNFTSADQLKVGDEVVVYGPLTLYSSDYGDTPETVQKECYVYSINGKVEEGGNTDTPTPGGEAKGSGTAADPFNVAGILAFGKEGNYSNDNPSKEVYVKGIVSKVVKFDDRYGQINYYISEDGKTGGEEFYVYGGLGVDGAKFTSAADLNVGANVVVCGKVTVYNGTIEFNYGSKIISITNNEGGNTGGEVTPGGDPVVVGNTVKYDLSNLAFENAASLDGQTVEIGGVKFTFAKGEGKTAPAYYTGTYAAARIYASNTLAIVAPNTMKNIVFNVTEPSSGKNYNGNTTATATSGTLSWPSNTQFVLGGVNAASVTICNYFEGNSGGTQMRIKGIEIEYVDAASARRAAQRARK